MQTIISKEAEPAFSRPGRIAIILALTALSVVTGSAILALALTSKYSTSSSSMSPTFQPGDYTAFVPYWLLGEPKRGDVVALWTTSEPRSVWIRRIIGVPGDFVALDNGEVLLNGEPVPRRKIAPVTDGTFPLPRPAFEETLPSGPTYTVLDIDPQGQFDNTEEIEVPAGKYFVMGDNRDNSYDSRSKKLGLVSRDDIIAKALLTYFSVEKKGIRFDRIGTRVR